MSKPIRPIRATLDEFRLQWRVLTFYERFEQVIAHMLSVVISVIISANFFCCN